MTTLQQLAWATHVHHYRFAHAAKPTVSAKQLLLALQFTFGEFVTRRIEDGDKLPESVWRDYQ